MRRIDQILGGNVFRIDLLACADSANIIKGYKANIDKAPWGKLPKHTQLAFKIAFISICHKFNWDFMQNTLAQHLLADDGNDIIEKLSNINARDLNLWLEDYEKPERIKAPERAAFLRDIGKKLKDNFNSNSLELFNNSKGYLGGPSGFISQLDSFNAFSEDPLRKKSYVLAHDLIREGILLFKDTDVVKPAIDYHIMRLYLRTGRVIPTSIEAMNELKGAPNPRPRFVKLLRSSVSEALTQTAYYAKLTIPDVNYIEWQIARSICIKDEPNCQKNREVNGLDPDISSMFNGTCPYISFCEAYFDENWRSLEEPELNKSFY